jgi:hypothetical protein
MKKVAFFMTLNYEISCVSYFLERDIKKFGSEFLIELIRIILLKRKIGPIKRLVPEKTFFFFFVVFCPFQCF